MSQNSQTCPAFLESAEAICAGAQELLERRERGEDILPAPVLPDGYDMEIEARWPADEPNLSRSIFERCLRARVYTLEDIASTDDVQTFASALAVEVDQAVQIVYAAKDVIAYLSDLNPSASANDAAETVSAYIDEAAVEGTSETTVSAGDDGDAVELSAAESSDVPVEVEDDAQAEDA